jgi:hypothetical protein
MGRHPWRPARPAAATTGIPAVARLRTDGGDVVHEWALADLGIMLKSEHCVEMSG